MKYVVAKCAQLWFKKKTEKYKVTLTQQQQSNVCACANFFKTRGGGEGRGGILGGSHSFQGERRGYQSSSTDYKRGTLRILTANQEGDY